MIKLRVVVLTLTVLAGLHAECIPGGMAVVVNKANPTESVSMAQLRKLILGDVRTWPDKKPVTVVTRDISGNLFKCVLVSIVRMTDACVSIPQAGSLSSEGVESLNAAMAGTVLLYEVMRQRGGA